jgi:DNA repair protein RecO (recombination protein O)
MSILSNEAIVLRKVNYSDSSVIVEVLTKKGSIISLIFSGKTKAKNQVYNILQPCSIIFLTYYDNHKATTLRRLVDASYAHVYERLIYDMSKRSLSYFIVEVTKNALKGFDVSPELYSHLKDTLISIDSQETANHVVHITYIKELLVLLGLSPLSNYNDNRPYFHLLEADFRSDFNQYQTLNQASSFLLHRMLTSDPNSFTLSEKNQLVDIFIRYFRAQLPSFEYLKSLEILRKLLH